MQNVKRLTNIMDTKGYPILDSTNNKIRFKNDEGKILELHKATRKGYYIIYKYYDDEKNLMDYFNIKLNSSNVLDYSKYLIELDKKKTGSFTIKDIELI